MVIPLPGTLADDRYISSDDDNNQETLNPFDRDDLNWKSISIEHNTGCRRLMTGISGLNKPIEVFPSLCFADRTRGGSLVRM